MTISYTCSKFRDILSHWHIFIFNKLTPKIELAKESLSFLLHVYVYGFYITRKIKHILWNKKKWQTVMSVFWIIALWYDIEAGEAGENFDSTRAID